MGRRAHLLALVAFVAFAGCARARFAMHALFPDDAEPAKPVEPPFAHAPKLQEGATCTDCHQTLDAQNAAAFRGLVFSHALHEKPAKGNCMRCHEAVATA